MFFYFARQQDTQKSKESVLCTIITVGSDDPPMFAVISFDRRCR